MNDRTSFEKVRECIDKGQRFVLTTHVNPDGDGLGSEAALATFLSDLGKDVYIYNSSPVPTNYKFLDPGGKMIVYDTNAHRETLLTADYIIILDISDWNRLRQVGKDIKDVTITKVCIDHHPQHEKFGDISLVNVNASSTGEIIYELIRYCKGRITQPIAEALYTSILTDTGSFKYSNTTSSALKIAGQLVESGVKPQEVYQKVYERQTHSKVRLLAHVLNNLNFEQNGKVAWFTISKQVLENLGAKPHDTEGFADFPRVIDGVEVTVMFIEMEHGRTKVSLRSIGNYVINSVAKKFGGGGHKFAAGVLLEGNLNEYIPKILEEISYLFKE